ncbi:MAG TPA: glycosyltransferase [Cytophagaceae bacterium]|jgi:glycosyltransferase involved in cell wall biosynthesis|nr:glycosyltransferase [Cytophagaceae bacterium]
MKILIALSRFPFPIEKGDKLRAYYQIKELSRSNELYVVCLTDKMPSEEAIYEIKKHCKQLEIIKQSFFSKVLNLAKGIFSSDPYQVHYFESSQMKDTIAYLISTNNIDICYVQLLRLFKNIPFELPTKYYLDYMDAFSEGMKKRIAYSHWYEKFIVAEEAKRLRLFEEKIAPYFDGHSMISQSDTDTFSNKLKEKLTIIPNGVSEEYFVTKTPQIAKEYDLIFTGNMGYHPNIQACKYLVQEILPVLKSKGVKIKICLAGINPSQEVLSLKSEDVTVTGYVKDMKEYLIRSKIFVAPLFSGSGLQNKLLEAMAAGLPTITTSLTNKALKAKDKKEIIICNESIKFAEQIIFLLNHPTEAGELARLGRLFVRENYNWRACNVLLEKSFKNLLH